MDQLNNVFQNLYFGFCDIAKIIFAIKMAIDILKHGCDRDIEGSIKVLITGGIGYGALYSVDTVLNMIQEAVRR